MHHAGTGAHRRLGHQARRSGHGRAAGDDPHRASPLVRVLVALGPPFDDVGGLHQMGAHPADLEPDVGQLQLTGEGTTGWRQQPWLQGGERHRVSRGQHVTGDVAGQGVDTARYVDGQYGCVADIGRRPPAVEPGPVGGVDDEICRWQHAWARTARRRPEPVPLCGQPAGRHPTVGAVVALAAEHVDRASVRPTDHSQRGPCHRSAGPLDEHVGRHGRSRVDGGHLLRRDDRQHAR